MDSIKFFEENKKKIKATTDYIAAGDKTRTPQQIFEEHEIEYKNKVGSGHREVIKINGQEFQISEWINDIRHQGYETFKIIAVTEKGHGDLLVINGNQFSSGPIDLDDIESRIDRIAASYNSIGLYIIHNHPYTYRASISGSDGTTLEAIVNETIRLTQKYHLFGLKCSVDLVDFAVVTDFDYWCVKQA